MKKIILTRGIPASGKSTWAKEQGADLVVNKDKIRELKGITTDNWTKKIEKEVVKEERDKVTKAMSKGENFIIVDNTHLGTYNQHVSFYREIAEGYGYDFTIKDFYCSREEAIKRDSERVKKVGADVIDKMFKNHENGGYPQSPTFNVEFKDEGDAYIFDIDGTLAFMDGKRSPYEGSKVGGDRANVFLIEILHKLSIDNDIIILSGRSDEFEKLTYDWLIKNEIHFDRLIMRKEGDKRKDSIVKKEIYETQLKDKYNVVGVFDDRQQVVDMWRLELGIPTYQVWYGNF